MTAIPGFFRVRQTAAMLSLLLLGLGAGAADNPCSNGSFETLAANGFPADWAPLGRVSVISNAHSGRAALRLVRAGEQLPHETGLNRGRLISQVKGGMDFAYRAVTASNATLRVYVIPVNTEGVERVAAPRAAFTVPADRVGDGAWHRTRIKYDYSGNPLVKSVHFAARIEGTAGELWLDDFAWLDRVGPLLSLSAPRLVEDTNAPGRRCTVHVPVDNLGDEPASGIRIQIELPAGLTASPSGPAPDRLAPGARVVPAWTVEGQRAGPGSIRLSAIWGNETNTAKLSLQPALEVVSAGPASPVVLRGEEVVLECLLANTGNATAPEARVQFACGESTSVQQTPAIPPGQSVLLRASLPARKEDPNLPVGCLASAGTCPVQNPQGQARVMVGASSSAPKPDGQLRAGSRTDLAWLENEHLRLVFRRNSYGFGTGELLLRQASGWRRAAWLTGLARTEDDEPVFAAARPRSETGSDGTASLQFECRVPPEDSRLTVRFDLERGAKVIRTSHEFTMARAGRLKYLEGPVLHVLDRDEALFPGVEWLVGHEVSSSSLDIAASHPDRIRHRVHPNWITIPALGVHAAPGTVGLLWNPRQKWDGTRDRPGAHFASPDRVAGQRAHRLGLFLPSVPEFVKPNTWKIETNEGYPLQAGQTLRLEALIYADGQAADALAAVDEWVRRFGIPSPAPPPRGSYEKEIEFSMRAYLESLWLPAETNWWTSKGGGILSDKGRPSGFLADLLAGQMLSPDPAVREKCAARVRELLPLAGGEARLDAQRFPGGLAPLLDPAHPAELLRQRDSRGAWHFNADQAGHGPFVGLDYHELGPDHAVELGTCAQKAFEVLRYARITGNREAWARMQPTLELMEQFTVPRAAQVWEVPVHTPDILAAADAVDAFLEAYRLTGDARWLRDAVAWARRGLPFVYLWEEPARPFLVGASIPVFGATWMQGSWFGRPVQWNGLRYAEALLKLAPCDQSQPWRQIAVLLVHSALQQQAPDGPNAALWPDNLGAINADKCDWLFAPRQILQNLLTLMGRDETPGTVMVGPERQRLHLTSTARIEAAAQEGDRCSFRVTFPPGEEGLVAVCNMAAPAAVLVNGLTVPRLADVARTRQAGWSYQESAVCLTLRLTNAGPSSVIIEGASHRYLQRLPALAERIAFEFDTGTEGWLPWNHITDLRMEKGCLEGQIIGGDPYLGRSALRVRADECPTLRLRLRLTSGQGGQLYWATENAPGFTEERVLNFPVQADGQFHEYTLELGKHPQWAGQVITGIRLDPGNGARDAAFAVDYLRSGPSARQP